MIDLLKDMNEAQERAIKETEGYVRLVSCAGSGKTRTLAHRYAYLVEEYDVPPDKILCLTFTRKAANEMNDRIYSLIGDKATTRITTFHGFCNEVLKEEAKAINYPKNFLIVDIAEQERIIREIMIEKEIDPKVISVQDALDYISKRKQNENYFLKLIDMSAKELYAPYLNPPDPTDQNEIIYNGYLFKQKKGYGLDFDDLISFTLYLFQLTRDGGKSFYILDKWTKQLEYIMVDEYQDINKIQEKLLIRLKKYHKNVFIVGDPDQTIYTWRGSDPMLIEKFGGSKAVTDITMLTNYRSTPEIVAVANSLIDKNIITRPRKKSMLAAKPSFGKKVVVHNAKTEQEETDFIIDKIQDIVSDGSSYDDVAVLYRNHDLSKPIEEALILKKIPFKIHGDAPFYKREEIKDSLAYLRMVYDGNDLDCERILNKPSRGVGYKTQTILNQKSLEDDISLYEAVKKYKDDTSLFRAKTVTGLNKFVALIEKFKSGLNDSTVLSDYLDQLLSESGYNDFVLTSGDEKKISNLALFKQSVIDFEKKYKEDATLENYFEYISDFLCDEEEFDSSDDPNPGSDPIGKVNLMTVHAAKGLQFPIVFVIGMANDIFPSKKASSELKLEEERRLAYVAITRAEKELYLTMSEGKTLDNRHNSLSRFIFNIDQELLEYTHPLNPDDLKRSESYRLDIEDVKHKINAYKEAGLKIGDRVRHPRDGAGTILDIDFGNCEYSILYDKKEVAVTRGFTAKLERI